ncbi:MAG TPA: hypothetical protein VNP89_10550 [Gaiellaceae bacterium]|nr:hypothetical protein [Gaiellaceae bacterium]
MAAHAQYDERWRAARWAQPVAVAEDKGNHGAALFTRIRDRGRVPSFVLVDFQSSSTDRWSWDREWKLTFAVLSQLRDHLPADCFPFAVYCGRASFVTGKIDDEIALLVAAERLHAAFADDSRLAEPGMEVAACYVDDGRAYEDMRVFSSLRVSHDLTPPPVFVTPARHLGKELSRAGLWSALGFVERVLPRRRALSGTEPTLVGVAPTGPAWEGLDGGDRYDVGSKVQWDLARLAGEHRQYLIDLNAGFTAAALLPNSVAVTAFESLVGDLRACRYFRRTAEYGSYEPVLEPGDLAIAAAAVPVPADADGATMLEQLRALLGSR